MDDPPTRLLAVPFNASVLQLGWTGQEWQPRATAVQITPKSCTKSLGKRAGAQALWPGTITAEQGD